MTGKRPGFLFLGANTPWVYALARHLAAHGEVTATRLIDWLNNARLKPAWPEVESRVRRLPISMPPGYAGSLEPLARPVMRAIIDRERARLRSATGLEPYVVCAYPYMTPWVRHIAGERLIYYNLDDYALYDAKRAVRTAALEDELIRRAGLTICLSMHQVEAFGRRHPGRAKHVRHFPLGVHESFLNPHPERELNPGTVGYVGNMTERIDWRFVREVAGAMPDVKFHFVGNPRDGLSGANLVHDPEWLKHRAAALALPNAVASGPVPQAQVHLHYWNYAVNWMPYDARHPFNIASCPTKLMDALASGRPFVSTDVPEARLYPDHVRVAPDARHAIARLRALLDHAESHNPRAQALFAARQTWDHRAAHFLDLLHG
jgi:teichuronic acid biosynthesis glycosyltransferase TuaH